MPGSRTLSPLVLSCCRLLVGICALALLAPSVAHAAKLWSSIPESRIPSTGDRIIAPVAYTTYQLDVSAMKAALANVPSERAGFRVAESKATLEVPMPDGSLAAFRVIESSIMAPELAAKYPQIKTYLGQGITDPAATMRFDLVPSGFHAQILSPSGAVYIDPYQRGDADHYLSYHRRDAARAEGLIQSKDTEGCTLDATAAQIEAAVEAGNAYLAQKNAITGEQLRTYRLAVGATGEYTAFHGGTVAAGLAAINVAVNRITGIYENEVSVRFELVANNDQIVYTNAGTDPYTNNNGIALLTENQNTCTSVIGSANYDIGHVFSTGGGGVASLGVVCASASKARGVTGLPSPIGDVFYVDFAAHEMGHQFNGTHTFNGSSGSCAGGNRTASTAYEPGSGTTIMAYAGICSPQNIQPNSDDYFHVISLAQISAFTQSGGGNACPVTTNTGNTPPVSDASQAASFTHVPINTPFMLTGSATDANLDDLTYCWEQFDLGAAGAPNSPTGNAPIFRSFSPVSTPTRIFPQISDIVNNTQTLGEILPSYARTLTFRLTARDNRAGGGGHDWDQISFLSDAAAGPFLVSAPNGGEIVGVGSSTVTWDVANTTNANVNCQTVDILLSLDGGFTYPITLATGTANDGSESVTFLAAHATTTARLMVKAADNIFFDISDNDFVVGAAAQIAVTPGSLSFTLAPDAMGSQNLLIENVGAAGAPNLNWTLSDVASKFSLVIGESATETSPATARGRANDDPKVTARQCRDCGAHHRDRTPVELEPSNKRVGVTDGGFEAGPFGGTWTESSTNFGTPLCDVPTCGTGGGTGQRSGTYWCWFGGFPLGAETGSVSQSVTIPSSPSAQLEFYLEVPACDSAADFMEVLIDGTQVFLVNGTSGLCGLTGYVLQSVDITAFADGGVHTLEFRSETFANNASSTNFFIDDVDIVVAANPCTWLSASPTAGSTPQGTGTSVTVTADATGLAPDVYNCELRISSDDFANPVVVVPVVLNVVEPSGFDVIVSSAANGPVSAFSPPDGSGAPLTAAILWDGVLGSPPIVVDATIGVTILDSVGDPVAGFPAASIGIEASAGGWTECPSLPLTADADTDVNGFTTISGVISALGFSGPGELLQVTIDDPDVLSITYPGGLPGLEYLVNSPDITPDGIVNLGDVGPFSADLVGPYDYRSDYFWDGEINLADVGPFSAAIGAVCPPATKTMATKASSGDRLGVYFDRSGSTRSIDVKPGETIDAYVVAQGTAAREGMQAWEGRLVHSQNVVLEEVALAPSSALNFKQTPELTVGLGGLQRSDQPLVLATLRLRVTDGQPARIELGGSELSGAALVALEGSANEADLRQAETVAAYLNDPSAPTGDDVASARFAKVDLRNSPNPFNPATAFQFNLQRAGSVEVRIYDVAGREVRRLEGGQRQAGAHSLRWNGTDDAGRGVGSGQYFYSLFVDGTSLGSGRMSLVK